MAISVLLVLKEYIDNINKVTRIKFVVIIYKFVFCDMNIYIFSFHVLFYFDW